MQCDKSIASRVTVLSGGVRTAYLLYPQPFTIELVWHTVGYDDTYRRRRSSERLEST